MLGHCGQNQGPATPPWIQANVLKKSLKIISWQQDVPRASNRGIKMVQSLGRPGPNLNLKLCMSTFMEQRCRALDQVFINNSLRACGCVVVYQVTTCYGGCGAPQISATVLVATPAAFLSLANKDAQHFSLGCFALVVFDEVHHVIKRHPYRKVARQLQRLHAVNQTTHGHNPQVRNSNQDWFSCELPCVATKRHLTQPLRCLLCISLTALKAPSWKSTLWLIAKGFTGDKFSDENHCTLQT